MWACAPPQGHRLRRLTGASMFPRSVLKQHCRQLQYAPRPYFFPSRCRRLIPKKQACDDWGIAQDRRVVTFGEVGTCLMLRRLGKYGQSNELELQVPRTARRASPSGLAIKWVAELFAAGGPGIAVSAQGDGGALSNGFPLDAARSALLVERSVRRGRAMVCTCIRAEDRRGIAVPDPECPVIIQFVDSLGSA